jgi:hypothetical protein
MKRLVQTGFLVGFAAVAGAAYLMPWVGYERYPSATTAVINGGRAERFVVRLPNDRIYAAGGPQSGTAVSPVAVPWPDVFGLPLNPRSRLEHYKLRDVSGNVIGVAVRHSTVGPSGPELAWLLSIPSRGSVVFAGTDSPIDVVENALSARGWQPGDEFGETVRISRTAELGSVDSLGEFEGLELQLAETWEVTGVDSQGELSGTIQLETVGRRL